MTPKELREVVAKAMCLDANNGNDVWERDGAGLRKAWLSSADAALAVVREALREPTPEIIGAWWRVKNGHHFHDEPAPTDTSDYAAYRAMLAASPLAEGNGDA